MNIPRLYAIVDASCFTSIGGLVEFARLLAEGGVRLIQYRNKCGATRRMLADARELKRVVGGQAKLIMNDRADLALAANFDGVHVGQDDLSVEAVRKVVGPGMIVGISTHNPEQIAAAHLLDVDYVAVGPVFATTSKENPDPVVGVDGVRRARELTSKPLVAIGGITRANARAVVDAGADSVAVISDLIEAPRESAQEFLKLLT